HPVFLRLREDLNPRDLNFVNDDDDVKEETVAPVSLRKTVMKRENEQLKKFGNQEVKLTNQNKIYFPNDHVTKGDVIAYYQSVAKYILPHLKDRPQSMNRFPNGINGMSFYQKDASDDIPDWIKTQKVHS